VPSGLHGPPDDVYLPGIFATAQNSSERAVLLSQGPVLRLDRALLPNCRLMLEPLRLGRGGVPSHLTEMWAHNLSLHPVPGDALTLEAVEKHQSWRCSNQTRGFIEGPKRSGHILKLHPNTLRSRMKKLGIASDTTYRSLSSLPPSLVHDISWGVCFLAFLCTQACVFKDSLALCCPR